MSPVKTAAPNPRCPPQLGKFPQQCMACLLNDSVWVKNKEERVMKKLLLMVSLMALYACGSTDYVGGAGAGLGSYTESQLTDDRYRVTFIGDSAATADQVKD